MIESMIEERIKDENCIMLCVAAGNSDLEVNASLDLINRNDKDRKWSLVVITKADLIAWDQVEQINNDVFNVGLENYFVVQNRIND